MQRKASSAVRAADPSESTMPDSYREPFWLVRGSIGLLAGMWKFMDSVGRYIIILGIGVSFAVSWLTSQNNVDPSTWRLSQYLTSLGQNSLVAVGAFAILAFIAFVARRADITKQGWETAEKETKKRREDEEKVSKAVELGLVK